MPYRSKGYKDKEKRIHPTQKPARFIWNDIAA